MLIGNRQAEAAKKSGGESTVGPSQKEVVGASNPSKPATTVEKAPKRKTEKDLSPEKMKKKIRILTPAKKKTAEEESITSVDLQAAKVPGLWTLYSGSTIVPPGVEKSIDEVESKAKQVIPPVSGNSYCMYTFSYLDLLLTIPSNLCRY